MSTFAETLARAQACQTVAEIQTVILEREPLQDWESDIFKAFEEHLLQAEAEAHAALCQTAEEAYNLWQATGVDSYLKQAYEDRWLALADAEAPAKAKACQTAEEAYILYGKAPDDSWAEAIYHARWIELELSEFAEKSVTCTTADEVKVRWVETKSDSPGEVLYMKLWIRLANAEAPAKALACTTVQEAWNLEEFAPLGSLAEAIYQARGEELDT